MAQMELLVIVHGATNHKALYSEVADFGANVIGVGGENLVHAKMDIMDTRLGDIIGICNKYGHCEYELKINH